MARLFAIVIAAIILFPFPAVAQRGQQIFDLFLQGAQQEIYRQQQIEFERQQRQELQRLHQQFVAQWQACHGGDVAECDAALSYPPISFNDRQALFAKRAAILAAQQEAAQRAQQQRIEAAERERAQEIARQQAELAWQRQRAEQAEKENRAAEARLRAQRDEQDRRTPAMLKWGALLLAATALVIAGIFLPRYLPRERLMSAWSAAAAVFRRKKVLGQPSTESPAEVPASEPVPPPPPDSKVDKPRDTAGALAALELAFAYIEEVRDADRPRLEDVAERKHQLNTLALAAKQLDLAGKLDPDAILEGTTDEDDYRVSINELKAEALLLEGTTHQLYDIKRAIPALVAATTLNPNSARAFYLLGLTYAANMSKSKAVAAFEQAVALDPKNIAYRSKELNRAQSLSGGEIAAYRATRAGERLFDAGVKTANAGIVTWNIFAVCWNILTFPIRIIFGLFRILRLHPFA